MKSYEEIAKNILKRRDEYLEKKKKKKRIVVGSVTPLLCCIVLVAGFGLWGKGFFTQTQVNSTPDNSVSSNKPSTTQKDFAIDSIDKVNFYSAKKIINEKSLLPFGTNTQNTYPNVVLLDKNYIEYPIERNKAFTVTMVTYFTIELNDKDGFLAQKLGGTGLVEVVITENDIETLDQMITFKRNDKYYTCLLNSQHNDLNSKKMSREFSSHKYIDGFNVVKNFEQENYKFIVHYEGSKVLGFECTPFNSTPTKYNADSITFVEDYCVVIFTEKHFTIDQLEVFLNSGRLKDEL